MVAAWVFRRHVPSHFGGESDLMATEDWLNQIHRTLNMLNVREDHIRISLATYQFNGEAYQWWLFEEEQRGHCFNDLEEIQEDLSGEVLSSGGAPSKGGGILRTDSRQ